MSKAKELAERLSHVMIARSIDLRFRDDAVALLLSQENRIAELEKALELCMTGGNHLANVLIGKLGGAFHERYPVGADHDAVLEAMGYGDTYEVWCCWNAIMRARSTLTPSSPGEDLVQATAATDGPDCVHLISEQDK
jgi:hypothetical protein